MSELQRSHKVHRQAETQTSSRESKEQSLVLPQPIKSQSLSEREVFNRQLNQMAHRVNLAGKSGKPVLLLVGENHVKQDNINMEIPILKKAKDLGIKTMFVEATEQQLMQTINKEGGYNRWEVTHDTILPLAMTVGCRLHPIDHPAYHGDAQKQVEKLQERDNYMAAQILKGDKDAIMCVGASHLQGIVENSELRNKYEIVPVLLPWTPITTQNDSQIQQDRETWIRNANDNQLFRFSTVQEFAYPRQWELIKENFPKKEDIERIAKYLCPDKIFITQKPTLADKLQLLERHDAAQTERVYNMAKKNGEPLPYQLPINRKK
jgi:hypothetical protein